MNMPLTLAQERTLRRYSAGDRGTRLYPDNGRAVAHTPEGLFLRVQRWELGARQWSSPYVLQVEADGLGYSANRTWEQITDYGPRDAARGDNA